MSGQDIIGPTRSLIKPNLVRVELRTSAVGPCRRVSTCDAVFSLTDGAPMDSPNE